MRKNFLFVCGDIGGARMQLPVEKALNRLGHYVRFIVDKKGLAFNVFREAKMEFIISDIDKLNIDQYKFDLIFLSTCASASDVEMAIADKFYGLIPIVMGADGLFNHGFRKWQAAKADYWFAINEGHKKAILELRSGFPSDRVKVVGQPAFDAAMDLIHRKAEIRLNWRDRLGMGGQKVALWWPTGMGEIIEEDIEMVKKAIEWLGQRGNAVFMMNGCHPKLESVRKGYIANIIARVSRCCFDNNVKFINTHSMSIPLEELCLASDVILSITCTEDIKNTLMGGPPVVHLLGPKTREWMEKELFLKQPHYLSDVISGESFLAVSTDEIPPILEKAFDPQIRKSLYANWRPPKEKATEKVAKELIALAR